MFCWWFDSILLRQFTKGYIMQFNVTARMYEITIEENEMLALIREEAYDGKLCENTLFDKLKKVDGVSNIDYNGHFGSAIFLTIDVDKDDGSIGNPIRNKIESIIRKHLDRAVGYQNKKR
jgi:hypothetical protein